MPAAGGEVTLARVRGGVAAGNPHSVEAAVESLAAGGNAVDAAVAAALACLVAEPLLASAGGAGIMVVKPADAEPVALDFFSHAPGRGLASLPESLDFDAIEIDFGSARQAFHIGRGAATVPMALDGLAYAARRFGRLPLTDLSAHAVRLARDGFEIDELVGRTFRLLHAILARDPACWAEIAHGLPSDRDPQLGERLRNPNLADTLEAFARAGGMPASLRDGLLAEFGPSRGGLITAADIEHAQVIECAPHRIEVEGWTLSTSPRLGGRLVGMIATQALAGPPPTNELDALLGFARASRAGHLARSHLGSTTHVSVVDAEGCAATVTLTSGEGCGHVVTGTGVHVNNFLGEEDLNPNGFHAHAAGAPLQTMIAPSVALDRSGRVIALGTGGANRIRSAVARVFAELVRGATLDHAITAPRVHAEAGPRGSEVWFEREGMHDAAALERALAVEFDTLHPFERRDFFFGGVHAVERTAKGQLYGVGDARRFGVARTSA